MIGDRWGVTDDEILRSYPCDDFVVSPTVQVWRGVRIEAPAEEISVDQIHANLHNLAWCWAAIFRGRLVAFLGGHGL